MKTAQSSDGDEVHITNRIKRIRLDTTSPFLTEVVGTSEKNNKTEIRHLKVTNKGKICLV